ncbi:hypothetical protein [Sutcliffiella horikoshii]|uniref:hypothetical protein n=1 Tax=Sutcliffiella horikoshii TaxID=79883 RepID=UPI003CF219AB
MIRTYSFASGSEKNSRKGKGCPANNFVETHTMQGVGVDETGNIPLRFNIEGFFTYELFYDFTNHPNKVFFQLSNFPLEDEETGFDLIVQVINDFSAEPVEIAIPFNQTRSFQFANVRQINVRLDTLNMLAQQRIRFYLEKTFCISCEEGGLENEMS